jgi:hypothetical protein
MRILVACEFSGVVRQAFVANGHDAWSCDLLPTEIPGNHYQGDIRDILYSGNWDLMVAHPPCTRLTNSGVRWLAERNLWREMQEAAEFFKLILNAPVAKIAVENPIPHKYALSIIGKKYSQIIQPWQFGHGETKATCLWLRGLPKLQPTKIVSGRYPRAWKMPGSKNQAMNRSRTYEGIARAMASQWGAHLTPLAPDVWYAPAQLALFTPEANPAEGKLPAPTTRR